MFFPIDPPQLFFFRSQRVSVQNIIILTILTIILIILDVSTVIGEDFGIPKRNPSFTQSSYSSPSAGSPVFSVAAQPAGKIGSQVSAPTESPASPQLSQFPNVVRLVAFDQSGQSFGSGSYIGNYGEYGLILSNWHVIYGADGLVHIHFPNGFSSYGAVILSDRKWDLALIVISRPPGSVPLLPISQTTPKPGDPLWIAGYGSGSYRLAGGRCVRYLAPEIPQDGSAPQYEIVDLSVSARQGDSGGPILNSRGELAGVLFGSDMIRNTAGSYCERVNRFLNQTRSSMESLPRRPEVYFASIEQGGPRRLLSDSLNTVPIEQQKTKVSQQRRADFAGSSMSFGTRSGSLRYTQPVPPASFSVFEKKIEDIPVSQPKSVESDKPIPSVPETPLTPLSFESNLDPKNSHAVRTAAWTGLNHWSTAGFQYGSIGIDSNPSAGSTDETPIIQVGHQISDRVVTPISSVTSSVISSEKQVSANKSTNNSADKNKVQTVFVSEISEVSEENAVTEEIKEKVPQGLISVSERQKSLPPIVFLSGFLTVSALLVFSFRLLKND
ncbi:MAG: serine protease [Planctomycetaceae bacterium]|nr:serine protease [Planctomycetaceae bacterium]